MPGIVGLVSQISTAVVAGLAAAGYPSLTDGKILLGRQHQYEQSAPPRIIFTPKASTFGPRSPASASNVAGAPSAETRLQRQQRSIATETVTFEVRCWGINTGSEDRDADYDAAQALYQQVIASTHLTCAGVCMFGEGQWTDDTQLVQAGREFVFALTVATPVLDQLLPYVTPGTAMLETVKIYPADGSAPEVGFSG